MSPSLLTADGLSGLLFLGFLGVTLAGALIAVSAVRVIRAVAGIYYFLNSPFVALMQILIYVGAVCVTIIFAVMLAESDETKMPSKQNGLIGPLGILASGVLTFALAALAFKTDWPQAGVQINKGTVADIGQSLLTTYSMSFELISVVLFVAIIGSVVLARGGRSK